MEPDIVVEILLIDSNSAAIFMDVEQVLIIKTVIRYR